jgi:hypothetical protein
MGIREQETHERNGHYTIVGKLEEQRPQMRSWRRRKSLTSAPVKPDMARQQGDLRNMGEVCGSLLVADGAGGRGTFRASSALTWVEAVF